MTRIAITGPESTGKSWLTKALAGHFGGVGVNEYAREYLTGLQESYTIDDLIVIAREQSRMNAENPAGFVVCDTEMIVMKIWSQVVFGIIPDEISVLAARQEFDLYLLCDIDLPWEPDPLREHPHRRQEIFGMYLQELQERELPFRIISGSGKDRLSEAARAIRDQGLLPISG